MFATLLAVVVALVLGHVAPSLAVSLRQYGWFEAWLRWLDQRLADEGGFWRGSYGVALALLPPLLLVGLFQLALDGHMFGFPALLFGVAVLFYAWGPRDLDLDVQAVADAEGPASRRAALERLQGPGTPGTDAPDPVAAVFRNARGRWFGVLFWFLLLGPFGALAYRLTALAAQDHAPLLPPAAAEGARWLLALLDWPVTVLIAVSLALVGNFDVVVGEWRQAGSASLALRSRFLDAVARASVRNELSEVAADSGDADVSADATIGPTPFAADAVELPELRDAMSLVWRVLLLWLALIALFVIGGWVG